MVAFVEVNFKGRAVSTNFYVFMFLDDPTHCLPGLPAGEALGIHLDALPLGLDTHDHAMGHA